MIKNKSDEITKTGLSILVFSLFLRSIVFFVVTPTLINVDEFYYLSRGKLISEGLIPYVDYILEYPPGAELIFSPQHFILKDAWVLTRVISNIVDALNAFLIFKISAVIYGKREGLIASFIYITNPLAIYTNTASMSETYTLLFILVGINLLLKNNPKISLAGYCFAFAFFVKYYTILFLAILLMYSSYKRKNYRRLLFYIPAFLTIFLFMTVSDYSLFIQQTIFYYSIHLTHPVIYKIYAMLLFLVFMQPHVLIAWRQFVPQKSLMHLWWYSSTLFILFPVVFEHHFLLTLPASCIISGSYLAGKIDFSLSRKKRPASRISLLFTVILLLVALSISIFSEIFMISMIYKNNPQPLFSDVSPVISYVKENTKDGDVILSDRAEFAYLSQRRSLLNYIWGHKWFFTADGLINKLNESTLIVVAEENNYPTGFVDYLEKDYDVKEFNGGFKVFQKGYKKAYSNNRSITSISHLTQKIYLD